MNTQWKAIATDGREVKIGTELVTRGECWILVSCYGKPAPSSGRVVVRRKGEGQTWDQEFYPSVFDLQVVPATQGV